jgi:EAL domain-containing protein (putative c-di-GMP-specific phosphodiesterase class I)
VASAAQAKALLELGCETGQGYLWGLPSADLPGTEPAGCRSFLRVA